MPRHVVHRLPDAVSFAAGVLVEPAACVLRGLERAGPQPGERIGVIGIGTLGSLATHPCATLRPGRGSSAMARVARSSSSPRRSVRTPSCTSPRRTPSRRPSVRSGDGLDIVVETAGAVDAVELATRLARPGGRIVLLGIAGEGKVLELPADRLMFADLRVIGQLLATRRRPWSHVVRLLERGLVAPRADRHPPLRRRPFRGRVRAHGQPRRRRRKSRSRAPSRLAAAAGGAANWPFVIR